MNLAVIGSGGREHAICYKLSLSKKIGKLICIPGNAGTLEIAEIISEDKLEVETEPNLDTNDYENTSQNEDGDNINVSWQSEDIRALDHK